MMLRKAGYLEMNRRGAIDEEGIPCEIVALHIHGRRFGIRIEDLFGAISGMETAHIMELCQNWQQYLGRDAGFAVLSRSGKALNLEFPENERYTISLDTLMEVLGRRVRFAVIALIPAAAQNVLMRAVRPGQDQQQVLKGLA
jgi:hypothetical protein